MIHIPQDLFAVLQALQREGRPYLVGGCVRDALLGRQAKDLDVEVFGTSWENLLRILRSFGRTSVVGRSFAVAKLRLAGGEYDFALPRRESKTGRGHRGFLVEPDPNLDEREASSRRDFTINALLYDPFGQQVLDFHGGRRDLQAGVLRHVGPAFADDPLRVLRGFQFAARFELELAPETAALCTGMADTFAELPVERLWGEWNKFATQSQRPSLGLRALEDSGWLRHFPEVAALVGLPQEPAWHPEGDVFTHVGHCLDALVQLRAWSEGDDTTRRILCLATLAHDFGKAETTLLADRHGAMRWTSPGHDKAGGALTDSFLENIGAPRDIRPAVRSLVENHHAHQSWPDDGPSAAAVRRLARRLEPATIEQLLAVMTADHLGRPPLVSSETRLRLERLREAAEALAIRESAPAPLLRGRDLLAAGLPPGPIVGEILRQAYEAQLDGAVSTTEEALRWAREKFPSIPRG